VRRERNSDEARVGWGICPSGGLQFLFAGCDWADVALTQMQLVNPVTDCAGLSRSDARGALTVLGEVVLDELGNVQKVRIGGPVQLTVRARSARKARTGRNPATGEQITIAAQRGSVDVRARPLARAKEALPSVHQARRRLVA